jgi:hypothetical protein
MSESAQRRLAARFLQGLETGGVPTAELQILAQDLDPVLVHVVVRYLRENYTVSNPAASAVLQRLMRLTSSYPGLVERAKEGERDAVSAWFAANHTYREFRGRGRELVDLVVTKLSS